MAKKNKSKSNGPTPPVTPKLASFPEPEQTEPSEGSPPADDPQAASGLGLEVTEPEPTVVPASEEASILDSRSAEVVDLSDPTPSTEPTDPSSSSPAPQPGSPKINGSSTETQPPPPPHISQPEDEPAPVQPTAALESATDTLASLAIEPAVQVQTCSPRPSLDLARPSLDGHTEDGSSVRTVALEKAYDKLKHDKDTLEKQYRGLVAKVGTMRDTLGKKLREDAEELDRREGQITTLTSENATLTSDIATLRTELQSQALETTALSESLAGLRQATSSSSDTSAARERELHAEMERVRVEKEEWEMIAEKERARAEDEEARGRELEAECRGLRDEVDRERESAKREKERGGNLQSVLEEFQAAKDVELRSAVSELETHLRDTLSSLSDWKLRATTSESRLNDLKNDAGRSQALEREVREKNLLIGKLRHETVIMNEHLTEALRRLRRNSSDTNVDRRLVTNILISFLTTPRADPKRFEMLTVLSSILSWSDLEREQAGLQRSSSGASPMTRRPSGVVPKTPSKVDEEPASESFSQLFVEFLLKEATSNTASGSSSQPSSSPSTPSASHANLMLSPQAASRPSYIGGGGASSPPASRERTFSFGSTNGGGGSGPPSPRPSIGSRPSFALMGALQGGQGESRGGG